MTTWRIIDTNPAGDRLTVKYTADDGFRSVIMPDMFWDQVTPIDVWLGRVNPFPTPLGPANPHPKQQPQALVGMSGTADEPGRTPPLTEGELPPPIVHQPHE